MPRFYNSRPTTNFTRRFNSGYRNQPVKNVRPQTPKPKKVKQRRTYRMANSFSSFEKHRVYVGSLTTEGLRIPIGPSTDYTTTSYFVASRNFNNYLPISVSLEFTPLLNQTNAQSMINAFLTTDVAADIPVNDVDMKNSTINHRGTEWFAAYRKKFSFKVPTLKQNTYETGSGDTNGNTPYEECAYIIIKPTSLTDKLTVGEIYLDITVKFTSPASPIPAKSVVHDGTISEDHSIKSNSNLTKAIFIGLSNEDDGRYMALAETQDSSAADTSNFYALNSDTANADAYNSTIGFGSVFFVTSKISKYPNATIYDYVNTGTNDDQKWVWQPRSKFTVNNRNFNNVVPSSTNELIYYVAGKPFKLDLSSLSIPVHNKITDDTDNTKVDVTNESLPIHTKLVDDVSDSLPVNLTNTPVPVTVSDPVHVHVDDQPILIKEDRDFGDDILDILKDTIIAAAAVDE